MGDDLMPGYWRDNPSEPVSVFDLPRTMRHPPRSQPCHHPEVRPDHYERDGAWVCVVCGVEFIAYSQLDEAAAEIVVLLGIIERLRGGWGRYEFSRPGIEGWCWFKTVDGAQAREPMSPQEVAVMSP